MSALTLPLDNRESNNYIAALERQFKGKFREARDMSVYFTSRPDTADDYLDMLAFFQDYKLLDGTVSSEPVLTDPLDTALSLAKYQIYFDNLGLFLVTGTGVLNIGTNYWLIPSGAEVTVTQNGSGDVPSAETFPALGDPVIVWIKLNGDEDAVIYLYPHTGKAWYGVLTSPAEDGADPDKLRIVLLMADGTFHTQAFGQHINENFAFFTHLYDLGGTDAEVYFTGKELDYTPTGLPTEAWEEPTFIYVPD